MDLRTETYSIKAEFAKRAALDQEDRERFNRELRRRVLKERKDEIDGRRDAEFFAAMLATPVQIEQFTHKLDRYDTATVDALMQNEEKLQEVRKQIENTLLEAHVLPDGRRVFRTRDGTKVFDEFGAEVSADTIRPDMIDEKKPVWEDFQAFIEREAKLQEERIEIQDYQQRLDEAREKAKESDLTKHDLDRLDEELEKTMPKSVRDIVQRNEAQRAQVEKDAPSQRSADISPESPPSSDRRPVVLPSQFVGPA